jgi:hypothetical protein
MSETKNLVAVETFKKLFLACKPEGVESEESESEETELNKLGASLKSDKEKLATIRGKTATETASDGRKKVDELRLALPQLEQRWDKLGFEAAAKAVDTFILEVGKIGVGDKDLEPEVQLLKEQGKEYQEKIANQRRVLEFVDRTAKEIAETIPKFDKPVEIEGRLKFCRSELGRLGGKVAGAPDRPEFKSLPGDIEKLRKKVDEAETAGRDRTLKQLTKAATTAGETEKSLEEKIGKSPNIDLYKEASKTLTSQMAQLGDWQSQIKEAASWLGTGTAQSMQKQIEAWEESCKRIRGVIEKTLPELKSKVSTTPPGKDESGAGEKLKNPEKTLTEECKKSWVEAKALYATKHNAMQSLADWRKKVVDEWLTTTLTPLDMAKGTGKGWVSVGSSDPTSDYDISINKHGFDKQEKKTVYDYKIVQMFNQHFRNKYGVETGTLFDTNLYASAPPSKKLESRKDATPEESRALQEINASMDVGALMKLRRYMSPADFENYRASTLASYPEKSQQRADVEAQFHAADDNYRISLTVVIDKVRDLLEKTTGELTEQQKKAKHILEEWDKKSQKYTGMQLAEGAAEMEHVAHELEELSDINTKATNDIYAEQIGKVREAEASIAQFDELREAIDKITTNTDQEALNKLQELLHKFNLNPSAIPSTKDPRFAVRIGELKEQGSNLKQMLSARSAELLSDLARQQAMSMFYANEAYQSVGPFKAVVFADQAVEPDVKTAEAEKYYAEIGKQKEFEEADADTRDKMIATACRGKYEEDDGTGTGKFVTKKEGKQLIDNKRTERRDSLTPEEVLQSFNEQLGDLLKDLTHYGQAEPGKAIIQSSKYLDRLLDAIKLMKEKNMAFLNNKANEELTKELEKHLAAKDDIKKNLIGARKGLIKMDPLKENEELDQDKERKAFACAFMNERFGVVSVAELAQLYSRLGVKVNAAARKELAQAK